jgi:hypothetical protein
MEFDFYFPVGVVYQNVPLYPIRYQVSPPLNIKRKLASTLVYFRYYPFGYFMNSVIPLVLFLRAEGVFEGKILSCLAKDSPTRAVQNPSSSVYWSIA